MSAESAAKLDILDVESLADKAEAGLILATEHEEEPVVRVVEQKRLIAGFVITEKIETSTKKDSNPLINRLKERRRQLCRMRQSAAELRLELQQSGIEALAVIPEKIWASLCQAGNLYRFENINENNRVACKYPLKSNFFFVCMNALVHIILLSPLAFYGPAGKQIFMQIVLSSIAAAAFGYLMIPILEKNIDTNSKEKSAKEFFSFVAIFIIIGFSPGWITSMLLATHTDLHIAAVLPLSFIASCIGCFIGIVILCKLFGEESTAPFGRFCMRSILRLTPQKTLNKILWPEMSDDLHGDDIIRTEITLPVPPEDVAKTLKLGSDAGYHLCTAAVSEAIRVNRDDLADSMAEQLRKDPIVYIKKDGLVAVIAQFGEFPVEQEIIDKISQVDFLD